MGWLAAFVERPGNCRRTCEKCGACVRWFGFLSDDEPCPACGDKGVHRRHQPGPRPRRRLRVRRIDRLVRIDSFGKRMRRLRRKECAA
jgi:hypothetical protein